MLIVHGICSMSLETFLVKMKSKHSATVDIAMIITLKYCRCYL